MKKIRSTLLICTAVLAFTSFSAPASAIPMRAVYTGTVSDSYDETNTFGYGTGRYVLDGLSYTLTFLFDPAAPGIVRSTGATSDLAYGGPIYGFPNPGPMSSANLTINGHTETISPEWWGYAEVSNNSFSEYIAYDYVNDGLHVVDSLLVTYAFDWSPAGTPNGLETPFTSNDLRDTYGQFQFVNADRGPATKYVWGSLSPQTLAVSRVSAVPLPAALPLLVAGIAALGLVGRKKIKQQ